jgi:hypothetical protein
LLTQGSHRSGRAGLPHPVPQIMALPRGSARLATPRRLSDGFALTHTEVRCLRCVSSRRVHDLTPRFPPPGPRESSSPASTVLSGRCDFLPPIPPHFVSFVWRYHSVRLCSSLLADPTPVSRPGSLRSGTSRRRFWNGDDKISHVPREPLLCLCPALRPRQARCHQATTVERHGPRSKHDEDAHD